MKIRIGNLILIILLSVATLSQLCAQKKNVLTFELMNSLNMDRTDIVFEIPFEKVKKVLPNSDLSYLQVFSGNEELVFQTKDVNADGLPESLLVITNIGAKEKKKIVLKVFDEISANRKFKQRAHAELYKKVDYKLENGYYTGGKFEPITEAEVPKDHFAHNALYKYEGPGWESDKAAYRFYLDSRNRNDFFGKKVDDIVLPNVGINDLVSDSKESYTKMNDWGMDIFKVGESIGLASIGVWDNNKVNTISSTERTTCKVEMDGPIRAGIKTNYINTKVGNKIFDLTSLLTIDAGSRITNVNIEATKKDLIYCTGLPKHADTKFYTDNKKLEWGYIAQYGLQSLNKDNLGIAVFYKKKDLVKITDDKLSQLVVLKSKNGKLNYKFAAAWDKEPNGITTEKDFIEYLDSVLLELSNPIKIK